VLRHEVAEAPELPSFHVEKSGELVEFVWSPLAVSWWETWKASPQAETFGSTDWLFLLETAVIVNRFWRGDVSVAAEMRLRVAKFGATPEDRARLRMQFAAADGQEPEAPTGSVSRQRRGALRAVPPPEASGE
jgi:hypothetical protein